MIKIIDLFAGPGGLGEGFSSFQSHEGTTAFSIIASVEKEVSAHKTLTLRSFLRKFSKAEVPLEYYKYIKGEISREDLFEAYPDQSREAILETLNGPKALGDDNDYIHNEIKKRLNKNNNPVVVIGGPPCQAYSLAGRAKNMNDINYNAKDDIRNFLYKEYLEILSLVEPNIFVMENVKGILSSEIDGKKIFPQIINDLKNPSKSTGKKSKHYYKIYSLVEDAENPKNPSYNDNSSFVIKSENYGIPQSRHRVILLGVRNDIHKTPSILKTSKQVNIEDAIGDLPPLRSGLSKLDDSTENWNKVISDIVKILPKNLKRNGHIETSKVISCLNLENFKNLNRGHRFYSKKSLKPKMANALKQWLIDDRLNGVLNHDTRGHITEDLSRYLFCSAFAQANSNRDTPNPKSHEFPSFLAPDHKNWESGKFTDRFRVQAKGKFATTITSHISKDGHYFIHYDPRQCRSLTVREAARIQTFPDNYFFEGNRTQQYVQVGNAVPPFLAKQIAEIVENLLSK